MTHGSLCEGDEGKEEEENSVEKNEKEGGGGGGQGQGGKEGVGGGEMGGEMNRKRKKIFLYFSLLLPIISVCLHSAWL